MKMSIHIEKGNTSAGGYATNSECEEGRVEGKRDFLLRKQQQPADVQRPAVFLQTPDL